MHQVDRALRRPAAEERRTGTLQYLNPLNAVEGAECRCVHPRLRIHHCRCAPKLNLSYTNILAPTTGSVNKKNVNVGANLSVSQDLLDGSFR